VSTSSLDRRGQQAGRRTTRRRHGADTASCRSDTSLPLPIRWTMGAVPGGQQQPGHPEHFIPSRDARGVPVPEAIREQILACTDLTQLDTWLRRASTSGHTLRQVT
jgi:hypothetical protein